MHDWNGMEGNMMMNRAAKSVTERRSWNALVVSHQRAGDSHLRKLFPHDPKRERITMEQMKEGS